MNEHQIWAQLDLRANIVCGMLKQILDESMDASDDGEGSDQQRRSDITDGRSSETEIGVADDTDGTTSSDEEAEEDEQSDASYGDGLEEVKDGFAELRDLSEKDFDEAEGESLGSAGEVDFDPPSPKISRRSRLKNVAKTGHLELDDGFFDLSSFNAETEQAEAIAVSRGKLARDSDDEDTDESIDLFAPIDDTEMFAEEDLENSGGGECHPTGCCVSSL